MAENPRHKRGTDWAGKTFSVCIEMTGAPIETGVGVETPRLPAVELHVAVRLSGNQPEWSRQMNVYRDRDCDNAEPLLITARKAAKMLAISTRYLYTLTKERQIGVVTVGRKRLYRIGDVQRFIDDRSDGPAPVGS